MQLGEKFSIYLVPPTTYKKFKCKEMLLLVLFLLNLFLDTDCVNLPTLYYNAQERILANGYPVELHHVTTEDGYVLQMHRIPYSPKNQKRDDRPVVFMQHGLLGSADNYVLADRSQAAGYLAADAGYDVWLGNDRASFYSHHIHYKPIDPRYWNFSFTEIGLFDLPASIDYILDKTKRSHLHYVGHSQGTTTYLVFLSLRPEYNFKIKSGHLLAPIAFLRDVKSPVVQVAQELVPFVGGADPERFPLTSIGYVRFKPVNIILANLCAQPVLLLICVVFVELYAGPAEVYTNQTLIPPLLATFPAGGSLNQIIHFAQLIISKRFQQFDWGSKINQKKYGTSNPPDFPIQRIKASTFFYYSNGDFLSSDIDVRSLLRSLNKKVVAGTWFCGDGQFNHFDYLAAKNLNIRLNNELLNNIAEFENK